MAAPALVPSPIRPSGEMAKTCEVVAMGREDVFLKPKRLLSAYDRLLLGKEIDVWRDRSGDQAGTVLALLEAVDSSNLDAASALLGEGGIPRSNKAGAELQKACKKGDGADAAKAALALSKSLK